MEDIIIFMHAFLYFVLGVQYLAIFLNLLRALLSLVNIIILKLKLFFMIREFRLLLVIDILVAYRRFSQYAGMCLYTIRLISG